MCKDGVKVHGYILMYVIMVVDVCICARMRVQLMYARACARA